MGRSIRMNFKSPWLLVLCFAVTVLVAGCRRSEPEPAAAAPEFPWQIDQFADLKILRYQVPGFEALTPAQKELVYYLSEAALCGRDIIFDQNYKHNLRIRRTLDADRPGLQGRPQRPPLGRVHDLRQEGLVLQRHPPSLFHRQVHAGIRRGLFRRPGQGFRGRELPARRRPDARRPPGLPAAHPLRPGRRRQEGLPGLDEGPGRSIRP